MPHSETQVTASEYLDRLMRRRSFEALWPLFAYAEKPAKEMTESFSALQHLRPFMTAETPERVIHIGDGAHAGTAALFALKTPCENISVDPAINEELVGNWQRRFDVERFAWLKAPIEDVLGQLNALPRRRVLVTFVHAHVDVDETLGRLEWDVAFTLSCCLPGKQLSHTWHCAAQGEDAHVLSEGRRYQVLLKAG